MSQFETGENNAVLEESQTTDGSIENDPIDSPFNQENRTDSSVKLRRHSDATSPVEVRQSGPIMTTQDSENNIYDLEVQQPSTLATSNRESIAVACSPMHTSANDLGLDPNLLHVFVFSDAGKPIYTRYVNNLHFIQVYV